MTTPRILFFARLLLAVGATMLAVPDGLRAQITVSWGTESEARYLADASGDLLPEGSLIWLGSFSMGTDFAGNSSNYSYLSSRFTFLDSAVVGDGGFGGVEGAFAAATVMDQTNLPLSYWVFNAATAGAATEWGVFFNTSGLWTTPSTGPNSLNTDIADADIAHIGTLSATLAKTFVIDTTTEPPSSVPDSSFLSLEIFLLAIAALCGRRLFRLTAA